MRLLQGVCKPGLCIQVKPGFIYRRCPTVAGFIYYNCRQDSPFAILLYLSIMKKAAKLCWPCCISGEQGRPVMRSRSELKDHNTCSIASVALKYSFLAASLYK